MILFLQNYQGTSGQVRIAFNGIFSSLHGFRFSPTCRVSLEIHVQKASYQEFISCPNVPSQDDDGSSILSGLVVKLYNRK